MCLRRLTTEAFVILSVCFVRLPCRWAGMKGDMNPVIALAQDVLQNNALLWQLLLCGI